MSKPILAAIAGLSLLALPASAQQINQDVVLVLDGSNSMWGQIEGVAKISIAKDVLSNMLDTWQPETAFGLVAYGHREEGNCSDIETLVGLGPLNDTAARSAVSAVRPQGKTPLTEAVRHAATLFGQSDAPGRIVLLTDGIETCQGDPCNLGEELAAQNVDLAVHVVGFDMSGQDVSPLRCLADKTGGSYRDASNASELASALADNVESDVSPRNVTVRGLDGSGELLEQDVQWAVYGENGTAPIGNRIAPEAEFALPAGRFRVVGVLGDVVIERQFDVASDTSALVELIFSAGTVNLSAVLAEGQQPYNRILNWDVALPSGESVASAAGTTSNFTLMPGLYQGRVKGEDIEVSFDVAIIGGETNEQVVNLNAGLLEVAGKNASGSATQGNVSWLLYPPESGGKGRTLAREIRRETSFLIPAGRYLLVGTYKGEEISQLVDVVAGNTARHEFSFQEP